MTLIADRPTKIIAARGALRFVTINNLSGATIRVGRNPMTLAKEGQPIAAAQTSPQLTVTDNLWALAIGGTAEIQVTEYGGA